jgi:hypothetical protein
VRGERKIGRERRGKRGRSRVEVESPILFARAEVSSDIEGASFCITSAVISPPAP